MIKGMTMACTISHHLITSTHTHKTGFYKIRPIIKEHYIQSIILLIISILYRVLVFRYNTSQWCMLYSWEILGTRCAQFVLD